MTETLSIRIDPENPNHHLWRNHGTWWLHYTVLVDGVRQRRVRRSLHTRDLQVARRRRDRFFSGVQAPRRDRPADPHSAGDVEPSLDAALALGGAPP